MEEDRSKGETTIGKLENGSENCISKGSPEEADQLRNGDDRIRASLEVFRELNKCCKSLGLCSRCQLRYLGEVYSSASFSLAQEEVRKVSVDHYRLNWSNSPTNWSVL